MWSRVKLWVGIKPLANKFWDTTSPTLDEIDKVIGGFPPNIVVFGELAAKIAEFAEQRERALQYGDLIGCTKEEIDRVIGIHLTLSQTTAYTMDWNRVRDDLLAVVFPHSTLGRTYAEADDKNISPGRVLNAQDIHRAIQSLSDRGHSGSSED